VASFAVLLWLVRTLRLAAFKRRPLLRVFKFTPYPLPGRPSTLTAKYGAPLIAARLARYDALNTWLAANITPDSTCLPEEPFPPGQALCVLQLLVSKSEDDGSIFHGPDTFRLIIDIEIGGIGGRRSPLMRLGVFLGSADDGDAPLWTRLLRPLQAYYIVEPRTFVATLACGMTDLAIESVTTMNISPRMRAWACTASLGTYVDRDVLAHCDLLALQDGATVDRNDTGVDSETQMLPRRRLVRRASPVKPAPRRSLPACSALVLPGKRPLIRRAVIVEIAGKENIDPRAPTSY